MKPKYIAILVAVVVGAGVAGIGLVSAGHQPTDDPSDVYIHDVSEIHQGPNAQICVEDMAGPVNKVTVEGDTTHVDTTIYHDGEDGDVVLEIPELNTPDGHKIVVFANEQNGAIESLQGTCTPPGVDVTERVILGTYYLATGHIELTKGVNVTTGPNIADDAPAPGSGSFSGISGASSEQEADPVPDTNETDDVIEPNVTDNSTPDLGETDYVTNETNGTVEERLNETKGEANTIVEHVQKTVDDAVKDLFGDDSPAHATNNSTAGAATGENTGSAGAKSNGDDSLSGAFGLTGAISLLSVLGLLFGFIRHWSS